MTTAVQTVPRQHSQTRDQDNAEPIDAKTSRYAAYKELAKPRIAMMVIISMGVGYVLGGMGEWNLLQFIHASIGVVLAVISSSTLNQLLERDTDARMPRTQNRPLPTGRLTGEEVFLFGTACGLISYVYLYLTVNPTIAWLTLATNVSYVCFYTPLKRRSRLCTAIGAIPGAMPPVLGWAATGNPLSLTTFALFAILFVWQFPHFLAIAWMYREQYDGAGLKMLPSQRPKVTGSVALMYAVCLIPISLIPMYTGFAGHFYAAVAVLLGVMYAWYSIQFLFDETRQRARRLLFASLCYLPVLLLVLTVDHLRLLKPMIF